jgi:hypothetical protein
MKTVEEFTELKPPVFLAELLALPAVISVILFIVISITTSCSTFRTDIKTSVEVFENGDRQTTQYYIDKNGNKIKHGKSTFISADKQDKQIKIYRDGDLESSSSEFTGGREDVFPNMKIPE